MRHYPKVVKEAHLSRKTLEKHLSDVAVKAVPSLVNCVLVSVLFIPCDRLTHVNGGNERPFCIHSNPSGTHKL